MRVFNVFDPFLAILHYLFLKNFQNVIIRKLYKDNKKLAMPKTLPVIFLINCVFTSREPPDTCW